MPRSNELGSPQSPLSSPEGRAEGARDGEALLGFVLFGTLLEAATHGETDLRFLVPLFLATLYVINRARQNSQKAEDIKEYSYNHVQGLRRIIEP